MSTLLPQPEKGKRTKFTPAVDWCFKAMAHNGILEGIISKADGKLSVEAETDGRVQTLN